MACCPSDRPETVCRDRSAHEEEYGNNESGAMQEGRDANQRRGGDGSNTQRHSRMGRTMIERIVWERVEMPFGRRGLGVHRQSPEENGRRAGECA